MSDEASHAPEAASASPGVASRAAFAHASEAEMARILDFYDVSWEYEPLTFPILWNTDGDVVESFSPDFYLPELDLFLEMTTLKQKLVRKKNRKLRRLRELYPDVRIKLFYARDFRAIMLKYGKLALVDSLSGTVGQVVPDRPTAQDEAARETTAVGGIGTASTDATSMARSSPSDGDAPLAGHPAPSPGHAPEREHGAALASPPSAGRPLSGDRDAPGLTARRRSRTGSERRRRRRAAEAARLAALLAGGSTARPSDGGTIDVDAEGDARR